MQLASYQALLKRAFLENPAHADFDTAEAWTTVWPEEDSPLLQQLKAQPVNRLRQYALMVRANIEDTLGRLYPMVQAWLMAQDVWDETVDRFIRAFPPQSYQLPPAVAPFPEFLEVDTAASWPFLADLARYEWIEGALLGAQAAPRPTGYQPGLPPETQDWAHFALVLNPVEAGLALQFDIPQLVAQIQLEAGELTALQSRLQANLPQPQATFVWACRHTSGHVAYQTVSPLMAVLLETLSAQEETPSSLAVQWQQLCEAAQLADTPEHRQAIWQALSLLAEAGLIVGHCTP